MNNLLVARFSLKFGNMSRLAKNPIEIPSGVTITTSDGVITVKGSKGELKKPYLSDIVTINTSDKEVVLTIKRNDKFSRSLWGTYASHIRNMITGVIEGYQKKLIVEGVGFKSNIQGKNLVMSLGFSHDVIVEIPEDLQVTAEKNVITIIGNDKERVGWFAGLIRSKKKPEPYKGKGIRYEGEHIIRKQGKKTA